MDQSSEIALNRCRRNSELLSGFSIEPLCNQLELFGILLDALNHVDENMIEEAAKARMYAMENGEQVIKKDTLSIEKKGF